MPLSAKMSTRFENTKATTLARMLDHRLLSEKAEARLARRIRAGDESATHELVRHNLRLAGFLADRFAEHHPSIDRDDLCSEAVLALYTARSCWLLRSAFSTPRRLPGSSGCNPRKSSMRFGVNGFHSSTPTRVLLGANLLS